MAADAAIPEVTDCPAWCGASHRNGVAFHAHCVGELHWKEGGITLVVTQRGEADGVEMTYRTDGEAPAIAFLDKAVMRRLRDSLDDGLRALDAA